MAGALEKREARLRHEQAERAPRPQSPALRYSANRFHKTIILLRYRAHLHRDKRTEKTTGKEKLMPARTAPNWPLISILLTVAACAPPGVENPGYISTAIAAPPACTRVVAMESSTAFTTGTMGWRLAATGVSIS